MRTQYRFGWLPVILLPMLFGLTACAGAGAGWNGLAGSTPEIHLTVLPGSFLDGGSAQRITSTVEVQRDEVIIQVSATAACGLKALYLDVASSGSALEVVSAEPSPVWGGAGDVLCLTLPERGQPGLLHFGAVMANYPQRQGFSGSGELARLKLRLRPDSGATRQVSTPPTTARSATTLTYETGHLLWRYYCQGDYDQNGIVNIGDLTPLGANFNTPGPFEPKSAISGVDGDGNGVIGIGDLSTIGQNFGIRVSGYHVYYSPSSADYPADPSAHNGAGAQLMASLMLGDGVVSAGERIRFEAPIGPPVPADNYWVRPYDGAVDGTPSNIFSTEATATWHALNVAGGSPGVNEAGMWTSLALVNGYPAIAYYDYVTREPAYVRASDSQGLTWGTPSLIVNDSLDCGTYVSLAVINGVPAVAYYSDDHSAPFYAQALDSDGAAWGTPIVIESSAGAKSMSLAEVNMRPAVTYYVSQMPGPTYHVFYERAGDAGGTDWVSAAMEIDDGESAAVNPVLAIIGGRPAVAYRTQHSQPAICFKRADNINGTAWGAATEVLLSSELLASGSLCLREVGGTPAVCFVYQKITGSRPAYARASDAAGTLWDAPAPQYVVGAGAYVTGDWMSMVVAGRQLYCAMTNYTTQALDCATAQENIGVFWHDQLVVDSGGGDVVGDYCSMASINGYPAVAYYDSDATALKYAVLY